MWNLGGELLYVVCVFSPINKKIKLPHSFAILMRLFDKRQVWDYFENPPQTISDRQHAVACSLASGEDLQVQQRGS